MGSINHEKKLSASLVLLSESDKETGSDSEDLESIADWSLEGERLFEEGDKGEALEANGELTLVGERSFEVEGKFELNLKSPWLVLLFSNVPGKLLWASWRFFFLWSK